MKLANKSASERAEIDAIRRAHYAKQENGPSEDAIASRKRPVSDDHQHAEPAPKAAPKAKAGAKVYDPRTDETAKPKAAE